MNTDIKTSPFEVGGLCAAPGTREHGELSFLDGEVTFPAAILNGSTPGKTVLIMAGIHADENAGILTAMELAKSLSMSKVHGQIIIIKTANPKAFEAGRRNDPADDLDLNLSLPGSPSGSPTLKRAYILATELLPKADYLIDLHSSRRNLPGTPHVYYPGKARKEVTYTSRCMAQEADLSYMIRSEMTSGSIYTYAAGLGIPGIHLTRGSAGGRNPEEIYSGRIDIQNILSYLGCYDGDSKRRKYHPLEVVDLRTLTAGRPGIWYPVKKEGDLFQTDEELGQIRDYGEHILENFYGEYQGVILAQADTLQAIRGQDLLSYGRINYDSDHRKERIVNYWGKRSQSFLEQRRHELQDPIADRWMKEIRECLPKDAENRRLRILDIGCGAGFFSILLSRMGHEVTGIDLTPEMIDNAKILAAEEGVSCTFLTMDAEKPEFSDESFDMVISRNLTWTLPHAKEAYQEWIRVLKKGGILLNFDGNYGLEDSTDKSGLPKNHAHYTVGDEMMRENEEIKKQLPINSYVRPAWDLEVLGQMGLTSFALDLGVSGRIYLKKDEFYNPTPLFRLVVEK